MEKLEIWAFYLWSFQVVPQFIQIWTNAIPIRIGLIQSPLHFFQFVSHIFIFGLGTFQFSSQSIDFALRLFKLEKVMEMSQPNVTHKSNMLRKGTQKGKIYLTYNPLLYLNECCLITYHNSYVPSFFKWTKTTKQFDLQQIKIDLNIVASLFHLPLLFQFLNAPLPPFMCYLEIKNIVANKQFWVQKYFFKVVIKKLLKWFNLTIFPHLESTTF